MIFSEKTIEIKENMTFSFLIDGYIFLKDSGFMALFRGGRSLLQWDVCNNSNSEAVTGNQEYIKIGITLLESVSLIKQVGDADSICFIAKGREKDK